MRTRLLNSICPATQFHRNLLTKRNDTTKAALPEKNSVRFSVACYQFYKHLTIVYEVCCAFTCYQNK